MQMKFIDIANTTVEEIHEHICDTAVEIANARASADTRLARKWRGGPFMNGSPYNNGALVLEIVEEYRSAPEKVQRIYADIAVSAIHSAIVHHQDLWIGLLLGEAKNSRNYFDRWQQAPTRLF